MPEFSPGPYKGEQRKHPKLRPASAIKAEIDKMIADFRKAKRTEEE